MTEKNFVVSRAIPSNFIYILEGVGDIFDTSDYSATAYSDDDEFMIDIHIQCGIDIIVLSLNEDALQHVPNGTYRYEVRRRGTNEILMAGNITIVE